MSVMENEHHCSLQGQVKRSGDIYYWNGWTELWGANQGWGLERGMKCCSWAMSGLLSFFSPQSLRMTSGLHLTFLSFPHMAPAWWVDCILLSCFSLTEPPEWWVDCILLSYLSQKGPSMMSGLHFTFMFLPTSPQHINENRETISNMLPCVSAATFYKTFRENRKKTNKQILRQHSTHLVTYSLYPVRHVGLCLLLTFFCFVFFLVFFF